MFFNLKTFQSKKTKVKNGKNIKIEKKLLQSYTSILTASLQKYFFIIRPINNYCYYFKHFNGNVRIIKKFGFVLFAVCRKDVRLPVQLQRAMAAEAEAAREARAKVSYKGVPGNN